MGRQNKDVFGDPIYPAQKRFVLELHYRKAAQQDCFYGARYSRAPGFSLFQVRAKAWLGSLPFRGYTNAANRRFDRANCSSSAIDRRHLFNLSSVLETPRFSNSTVQKLAGSWKLAPILSIRSGSFFTVTTSTDVALNGIGNQRLNQILPNFYGDKTPSKLPQPRGIRAAGTGHARKYGWPEYPGSRMVYA